MRPEDRIRLQHILDYEVVWKTLKEMIEKNLLSEKGSSPTDPTKRYTLSGKLKR